MFLRIRHSLAAASLVAFAVATRSARASNERPTPGFGALVVLIGDVGASDALRDVISELLERQGVSVEYELREKFSAKALLGDSDDARVRIFVSEPGPHVAKLYFRGPTGERFLLRKLALKNGLDELGRELIGQVVETSTVALLHSDAGVSREEARAGMTTEGDDSDVSIDEAPAAESSRDVRDAGISAPRRGRSRFDLDVDARGFVRWSGTDVGVDHGLGAEAALAFRLSPSLFVRGRAEFEYGFVQSIEAGGFSADVRAAALRFGADVGAGSGKSAFFAGLLAGADFTNTTPRAASDPTVSLAGSSGATVPMIRVEARYELGLGIFRMTAGVFADTSLEHTHYDVADAAGVHQIAAPWPVRPGAALTLGIRSGL